MIKDKEKCDWFKLIYIADNPTKDFINLNKKQVVTVRVLQGIYKNTKVKKVFDGLYKINSLNEFPISSSTQERLPLRILKR